MLLIFNTLFYLIVKQSQSEKLPTQIYLPQQQRIIEIKDTTSADLTIIYNEIEKLKASRPEANNDLTNLQKMISETEKRLKDKLNDMDDDLKDDIDDLEKEIKRINRRLALVESGMPY